MMRPVERLRCYVDGGGEEWKAYCVDADVSAVGRSAQCARARLGEQLDAFVSARAEDAVVPPRPPMPVRLRYHVLKLRGAHGRGNCQPATYDYLVPPEWIPGLA